MSSSNNLSPSSTGVAFVAAAAAAGCAYAAYCSTTNTRRRDGSKSSYPAGQNDRPASRMEAMMQGMHSQGRMHTICLVRVGGRRMSLAEASRAASRVARRHPVMAMRLVAGSEAKRPGDLWLREHQPDGSVWDLDVRLVTGRTLVEAGEDLCNSVLFPTPTADGSSPPAPLWRLAVVHGSDDSEQGLVFALHHGFFDGTSRFRVVKDFMAALAEPEEAVWAEAIPTTPSREQRDSLEAATSASWAKAWAIRARYAYNAILGPACWRFPLGEPDGAEAATRIRPVAFTSAETSRLRLKCRENGTTVHAAVCAAAQLALLDIAGEQGTVHVSMMHLASTRHVARPAISDETLGLFIDLCATGAGLSAAASDPWEVARDLKAQLVAQAKEPGTFWLAMPVMMLCGLLGLGYGGRAEAAAGRRGLLNVSNLGLQHFEEDYGGRTVEGVYSGTAEHHSGPVVCFNLSSVRGRLHGTIMYYQPVWQGETAARFEDAIRARLTTMTS